LAILASALRSCSRLPFFLLLSGPPKSAIHRGASTIFLFFALLPFLPTLTPNGGELKINKNDSLSAVIGKVINFWRSPGGWWWW
jgi:hypothetical protein